jgi:hypothetical protein
MVNWSNKQDSLYYTKPIVAPNDVPELPQASVTPTRLAHSYSDITYEWAIFRSTGRKLDEYKPFDIAGKRMNEVRTRLKGPQTTINTGKDDTIEDDDEEELGQEVAIEESRTNTIERFWLYVVYTLGFNESAGLLVRPLTSLLYADYFYRNLGVYSLAWFTFYFQEYVYVWLALHFPFLDFLTLYPIYDWPAHIDMYFGRLIFAAFFIIYFACFFFQYRLGTSSKFDQYGAMAQFAAFFGSAFCYYRTGLAPFLFLVGLTVCFAVPYTFFYFVPRQLINLRLQPPLLLPAPAKSNVLYLPKYCYRYPYFPFSEGRRTPKRFTAFPFTINVRGLAASQRFIRRVLVHDYLSTAVLPAWASPVLRTPPVGAGPFEMWYGFNPYDTYEESFMRRSAIVNAFSDSREKAFAHQVYQGLKTDRIRFVDEDIQHSDALTLEFPDRFYSEDRFPPWMHNTTFFSRSMRQTTRSLYRDHFTPSSGTSFFSSGPRPALWQVQLARDPYFGLYIWLKHTAPVVHKTVPHSKFTDLFVRPYVAPAEAGLYPYFSVFVRMLYGVVARFFDRLTLGRYRTFDLSWKTMSELNLRVRWLNRYTSRLLFYPTTAFMRATLRFCLMLESKLDKDTSFCNFVSRSHGFRYTLLHHLGTIWVTFGAFSLRARRKPGFYLLLRTLMRLLPRVLFKLTRLRPPL